MEVTRSRFLFFFLVWLTNPLSQTLAFAHSQRFFGTGAVLTRQDVVPQPQQGFRLALQIRGGDTTKVEEKVSSQGSSSVMLAPILSLGKQYSAALERAPILTKSLTAGCIFALSDLLAQRLERKPGGKQDWPRTITSGAVGLLCFGPAAHAWYNMMFRVFPGTGLVSTLQKASMGQIFFGPSFTCVFFAASLLQTGQFSLPKWFSKIRSDLPGAWLSGLCFWPLIDVISYSVIPVQFIPLFVNLCSLVWNIYLSTVANRGARVD